MPIFSQNKTTVSGYGYPWKNISLKEFSDDITSLFDNGFFNKIDQGVTLWCGATCAVYLSAILDYSMFMSNAKQLFFSGFVEGGWFTLDLDASSKLLDESKVNASGINNVASFITISTMKNNYHLYNKITWDDISPSDYKRNDIGITTPNHIEDYLTTYFNIKYKEGDGKFDSYGPKSWGIIDLLIWNPTEDILDLLLKGYKPLLIVDSNALIGGEGNIQSQHYLVVNELSTENSLIKLSYYNPNNGNLYNSNYKEDTKTYTKEKWEIIINWYGGFKSIM